MKSIVMDTKNKCHTLTLEDGETVKLVSPDGREAVVELSHGNFTITNVSVAVAGITTITHLSSSKTDIHPSDVTFDSLGFSVRVGNRLRRSGINSVEDLTARTRENLLSIKLIGASSMYEIQSKLATAGLHLASPEANIDEDLQSS